MVCSGLMGSEKFRRQLRECARQWRAEGEISEEQYQHFAARYQFDSLETSTRNRLIAILIGLGAILVGIGAIALVEANWQVWSRSLKISLLMGLFVGMNAIGFYLWRVPGKASELTWDWQHRVGQGLLLFGSVIMGANMVLIREMFLLHGARAEWFLIWGLGVLGMAYSLRLKSAGMVATALIGLSYWPGLAEVYSTDGISWLRPIVQHMPLMSAFLLLPLAYWCRSRFVFLGAAILLMVSLEVNLLVGMSLLNLPNPWMLAIAYALPPTLLWSYDDNRWQLTSLFDKFDPGIRFRPLARTLALVFLTVTFYFMSFHWFWSSRVQNLAIAGELESWMWTGSVAAAQVRHGLFYLVDVAIVLGSWVALEWNTRFPASPGRWKFEIEAVVGNALGCAIAIASGVLFWHVAIEPLLGIGAFVFNLLLFFLGYGLIREAVARGVRGTFWWGTILLAVQIFSRAIEYNMGLGVKAVVFLGFGVCTIALGLWFEHYLIRRSRWLSLASASVEEKGDNRSDDE